MKVGNIVSPNKLDVSEEFNIVKSINEINKDLPTLIIGFDYVNKHYPSLDILNRTLKPNLYWTFKKSERRDLHDEDIHSFIINTYKHLISNITYLFIDPIHFNKAKLIKIIRKLKSTKITSYLHDNMIYIYCDNIIFGIDLKLLKYMGFNLDKIKNKIKIASTEFLEKDNIFIEYEKHVIRLGYQVKYIPFLYSINNG